MASEWNVTRDKICDECIEPYVTRTFQFKSTEFHFGMKPSETRNGFKGLGIGDWINWERPHVQNINTAVKARYSTVVLNDMKIAEDTFKKTLGDLADLLTNEVIKSKPPPPTGLIASLAARLGLRKAT